MRIEVAELTLQVMTAITPDEAKKVAATNAKMAWKRMMAIENFVIWENFGGQTYLRLKTRY